MKRLKKQRRKKIFEYKEKGITLIALVVTIIVLLILAGISISMLAGNNGILNKAIEAKEKTEEAEKNEKTILSNYEDIINEYETGVTVEQVTDSNPGVLEGTGTESDPYIINSIEDLVVFAYNVREGNTYEGEYVNLGLSLDFNSSKSYIEPFRTDYGEYGYAGELKTLLTTGEGFKPIGTESYLEAEIDQINTFKGTFDGNNNVIYGLYINQEIAYNGEDYDEYSIGLFGYNEGTIQNLGLVNNSIKAEKISGNCNVFAGALVGRSLETSVIDNCYNQGNVTTNFITGGIAGRSFGVIQNSYNAGTILGCRNCSGISNGMQSAEFTNCFNLGNITSNSSQDQINIAGISSGGSNIDKCFNLGKINATMTGSLSAFGSGIGSATEINNSYNLGQVTVNANESSGRPICQCSRNMC